ncbi:hypothetical protein [Aquimarina muelleri]|uniref:DUF2946 domain-containing protein n=1 Tax=Aquimarina muelleri TaxID=279356 RepID=A0A918JW52_9FLAO|nr:hypothetical protein [Aquimarina muelleri]MCX2762255.1 hypothetical protein [Aquimarina muelleri]GGX18028.1 hypothetical protein GCM10007384_19380 [Aquimarina muelleri]
MKNINTFSSAIRLPFLAWVLLLVFLTNPIIESFHHLTIIHSNLNPISNDLELHSSNPDCILCDFIINRKIPYLLSNSTIIKDVPKDIVCFTPNLIEALYVLDLLLFPLANSPPLS